MDGTLINLLTWTNANLLAYPNPLRIAKLAACEPTRISSSSITNKLGLKCYILGRFVDADQIMNDNQIYTNLNVPTPKVEIT